MSIRYLNPSITLAFHFRAADELFIRSQLLGCKIKFLLVLCASLLLRYLPHCSLTSPIRRLMEHLNEFICFAHRTVFFPSFSLISTMKEKTRTNPWRKQNHMSHKCKTEIYDRLNQIGTDDRLFGNEPNKKSKHNAIIHWIMGENNKKPIIKTYNDFSVFARPPLFPAVRKTICKRKFW